MEMKLLELDQVWGLYPEPGLNIKTVFPGMGILMLKIRRPWDRLVSYTRVHGTSAGIWDRFIPA